MFCVLNMLYFQYQGVSQLAIFYSVCVVYFCYLTDLSGLAGLSEEEVKIVFHK